MPTWTWQCRLHPSYTGSRPPRATCDGCRWIWFGRLIDGFAADDWLAQMPSLIAPRPEKKRRHAKNLWVERKRRR